MYRRCVAISVSLTAALAACADPDSPPALDGGVVADAAADRPLRPVTVTVETRRRPAPGVRVFTSASDGRFIADGVTDAEGKVTLTGGATATAFDVEAVTAPIGADDTVLLGLLAQVPVTTPTTWAVEVAAPPPSDAPMRLRTPCSGFDPPMFVPSAATTSVEGPACPRTATLALLSPGSGTTTHVAGATVTAGAPARFETWHELRPIQVTVDVAASPSGPISVTTSALISPDMAVPTNRTLPVGLPGAVSVSVPGLGGYARYFESAATTMTLVASDFMPPLRPLQLVGDTQHLRGVQLTDVGRTFDACFVRFATQDSNPAFWTIATGPITDARHVVHVPVIPNAPPTVLGGELDVTCFENHGFADPTRPARSTTATTRW